MAWKPTRWRPNNFHGLLFDKDFDGNDKSFLKTHSLEVIPPPSCHTDTTRNLYKDEGINFKQILQAQQANTHIHVVVHQVVSLDSWDDEEEFDGLKVNSHWLYYHSC